MTTTQRTVRVDFQAQRARADLASFGAEVDQLIAALSDIQVNLVVDQRGLKAIRTAIDRLDTVVEIDLNVNDDAVRDAAGRIADLSTDVDVGIEVEDQDLAAAASDIADLARTVDVGVDVDERDIDSAVQSLGSIDGQILRTGVTVDGTDIDSAIRSLESVDGQIVTTGVDVIDTEIRAALGAVAELDTTTTLKAAVDDSEITAAVQLAADLNETTTLKAAVDDAEIDSALRLASDLDSTRNTRVNVTGDLDAAARKIDSLDSTQTVKIDVDDSALDSALDKAKGLAAGVALGSAVGSGFSQAIERQSIGSKISATLTLSPAEAERAGKITGDLYANAYGDSVGAVGQTVRDAFALEIPDDQIQKLVAQAFSLETGFGGAASEYLQLADQLKDQGVVDSVQEGLDFIVTGFKQLPGEMQQPLLEAVSEYGVFLTDLGFSTEETFAILTNAAGKGEFALDKAGDALKEFGIRATDGSAASTEAFDLIGLSSDQMANQLLAGGDQARSAFDKIIDGLLGIEDPQQRANAAIALFGTPLEDLSVQQIPAFLEGLRDIDGGFSDVEGAAALLDTEINDNLGVRLETFKRTVLGGLATFLGEFLIPAFEGVAAVVGPVLIPIFQEVSAAVQGFAESVKTGSGDASGFGAILRDVLGTVLPVIADGFRFVFEQAQLFFTALTTGHVFGGSATPIELLAIWIRDTLLPGIRDLVTAFVDEVIPAAVDFGGALIDTLLPALQDIGTVIIEDVLPVVVEDLIPAMFDIGTVIVEEVLPVVVDLVTAFAEDVLPVLADVAKFIAEDVVPVIVTLVEFFGDVLDVLDELGFLLPLFEAALSTIIGPIAFVGDGLGGISDAGGVLSGVLGDLGGVFVDFAEGAAGAVGDAVEAIGGALSDIGESIGGFATDVGEGLGDVAGTVGETIGSIGESLGEFATDVGESLGEAASTVGEKLGEIGTAVSETGTELVNRWGETWNTIAGIAAPQLQKVEGDMRTGFGRIGTATSTAWTSISSTISESWSRISTRARTGAQSVASTVASGFSSARTTASRVWSSISQTVSTAWSQITSTVGRGLSAVGRTVSSGLNGVARFFGSIWDGITGTVSRAVDRITGIVSGLINSINRAISRVTSLGNINVGSIIGRINPFYEGGVIEPGRPTLALFEGFGREVVLPEYASLQHIKKLLGRTNILDRLAADFNAQQRHVFEQFNNRADTDRSLSDPGGRRDGGGSSPMYVDRSTHTYDVKIVEPSGSTASKQRTASTLVDEVNRRRRPPRHYAPTPGRWRSDR